MPDLICQISLISYAHFKLRFQIMTIYLCVTGGSFMTVGTRQLISQ